MDIRFDRPLDVAASVATYSRWGDDLVDRFVGRELVRTISPALDAPLVAYALDVPRGLVQTLTLTAPAAVRNEAGLAAAVRATFLTEPAALEELGRHDAAVAELAARYPGLVPVLVADPFTALIRSISAQQINLRWASVIRARLAERYGTRLEVGAQFVYALEPAALAEASTDDLRALQLTGAKARAVVATARAATAGELRMSDLAALDDEALIAHLVRLPGIGRWSAEWFMARTMGRPRVVAGDLGVRKAIGRLYGLSMPSEIEVRRLTDHWAEAASIAQVLALNDLALSPDPAPAH